MVSLSPETAANELASLLAESLRTLGCLHASAAKLRAGEQEAVSDGPVFSSPELDRLSAVVRRGVASIEQRLKARSGIEGRGAPSAKEFRRRDASALPAGRFDFEGAREMRQVADQAPRSLLAAYRAACRALCAALREAQHAADKPATAILSGLLHDLEKQLWVLDSSPGRIRVGLPTIDLFLSC